MRILLISSSYPPVLGGLQTVVHQLAQHLQHQGHSLCVLTNRHPWSLPSYEVLDSVGVNRTSFLVPTLDHLRRARPDLFLASTYFYPLTLARIGQIMRDFQPEVVNFHFPTHTHPFARWLRRRTFRLVVSLHGHDVLGYSSRTTADQRWFRDVLRSADAVTACSQYLLGEAAALEPVIDTKGYVIHNGVDRSRFNDSTRHSHPRSYVLTYGRLTYAKGTDLLIQAFAEQAADFPQYDLIIAGNGEDRAQLEAQVNQLSLGNRILFYGRASPQQIVHLLNGCEFVVLPRRSEPFGIVAIEAMAAGKAVLATQVGGLPEILTVPPNCLVEPTFDGLSSKLREWLTRVESVKLRGLENRTLAVSYDWSIGLSKYEKILNNYPSQ